MIKNLSYQNLETLVAALGILHSEISFDTLPERALAAVASLFPVEMVSFDAFDAAAHYTQTQWNDKPELLTPEVLEIFSNVVHEHLLIPEVVGKGRLNALKMTDVISQSQFEKTALYNEFFRRIGSSRQMGMALPVAADFNLSCGVVRHGKDFTERERTLLNLIAPHLLTAIRHAYFVQRLEQSDVRWQSIINSI